MPNKITAPIARSTAYDFNCKLHRCHQLDRHSCGETFAKSHTDEDRHIMPHEILFTLKDSKSNGRMRAMSSLNGIDSEAKIVDKLNTIGKNWSLYKYSDNHRSDMLNAWNEHEKSEDENVRQRLRQANTELTNLFQYVGVAITGCQAGAAGALQRQGFSATRGGLMTIVNTGEKNISPGAQIRMEFDWGDMLRANNKGRKTYIEGIPRTKLIPRIVADEDPVVDIHDAAPLIFNLRWAGSFAPDPILLHRHQFAMR